jgi:hypothetical protein
MDENTPDAAPTGASRPGAAEAYHIVQQALARAVSPRWPLYVRQVKQLIKTVESQFDERRYGFGSLVDALKHCQREGLLRLERDRQGIIRVWPGPQFQKSVGDLPVDGETLTGDLPAADFTARGGERGTTREGRSRAPEVIDVEPRAEEPALPYDGNEVSTADIVELGRADVPFDDARHDEDEQVGPGASDEDAGSSPVPARGDDSEAREGTTGVATQAGEAKARGGRRRTSGTTRPASRARKTPGGAPRKTTGTERRTRARKPKGQD